MLTRRLLVSCLFLACLPLSAEQSNKAARTQAKQAKQDKKANLIYSNDLMKILKHEQATDNIIKFSIEGYNVLGLLHSRYKKLQLVYIFPTEGGKDKTALEQTAKELVRFLLGEEGNAKIHVHKEAAYAQIMIEENPDSSSKIIDSSTTNAVLYLNKLEGPPYAWRDNRLIWQIIFNNGKTCLELALDLSKSKVDTLDFKLMEHSSTNSKTIRNQLNSCFGLSLREHQDGNELRDWRDSTGYSTTQLIGLDTQSKKVKKADTNSYYLVKKENHVRLAKRGFLKLSDAPPTHWVKSAPLSFPSELEDLSSKATEPNPAQADKKEKKKANPDNLPSETPDTPREMTPAEALDAYIEQLQAASGK